MHSHDPTEFKCFTLTEFYNRTIALKQKKNATDSGANSSTTRTAEEIRGGAGEVEERMETRFQAGIDLH